MKKHRVNIGKELKQVFRIQASGIRKAEAVIGPAFETAVRMLFRCRGKVIVTGIGKSGIIAEKIASTFASTGTPAIFLHPVEGMHGNVGIVGRQDVVLAIGKSGESEELLQILPTLHKIGATIIAVTANNRSSLARASDLVLEMPAVREACPLNLAPTTSSTLALVIGDALAVVLMKMRGFSAEKFALYHPGGQLGKRLLLRVRDIMRGGRHNPVVHVDESMAKLVIEISRKWTGAASVVDRRRRLVGLATDYDIRQAFAKGGTVSTVKIRDIMNANPTFIYDDEPAMRALEIMESRKKPFTVLPVVDRKRRSVGMIHLHDLVVKGLISDDANTD